MTKILLFLTASFVIVICVKVQLGFSLLQHSLLTWYQTALTTLVCVYVCDFSGFPSI